MMRLDIAEVPVRTGHDGSLTHDRRNAPAPIAAALGLARRAPLRKSVCQTKTRQIR